MTGPKDMAALRLELAETRQSLSRVKARLRKAEERAALSQKSAQEAWKLTEIYVAADSPQETLGATGRDEGGLVNGPNPKTRRRLTGSATTATGGGMKKARTPTNMIRRATS